MLGKARFSSLAGSVAGAADGVAAAGFAASGAGCKRNYSTEMIGCKSVQHAGGIHARLTTDDGGGVLQQVKMRGLLADDKLLPPAGRARLGDRSADSGCRDNRRGGFRRFVRFRRYSGNCRNSFSELQLRQRQRLTKLRRQEL